MPVSMLGLGRGVRTPSAVRLYCMKTRFQISRYRSHSHLPMPQSGPQDMASPWSMRISEQGPQGPVSPMDQKLSFSPMPTMREGGSPEIFSQRRAASSSSWKTVAHNLSAGSL